MTFSRRCHHTRVYPSCFLRVFLPSCLLRSRPAMCPPLYSCKHITFAHVHSHLHAFTKVIVISPSDVYLIVNNVPHHLHPDSAHVLPPCPPGHCFTVFIHKYHLAITCSTNNGLNRNGTNGYKKNRNKVPNQPASSRCDRALKCVSLHLKAKSRFLVSTTAGVRVRSFKNLSRKLSGRLTSEFDYRSSGRGIRFLGLGKDGDGVGLGHFSLFLSWPVELSVLEWNVYGVPGGSFSIAYRPRQKCEPCESSALYVSGASKLKKIPSLAVQRGCILRRPRLDEAKTRGKTLDLKL